jgi:osmotically-inducible protein OsmY
VLNRDVKQHVETALEWVPSVDTRDLSVSVADGVVTLRGTVASVMEKMAAEMVVLEAGGVKAVANDLNIRLRDGSVRTDTEIAQAALAALKWNALVPADFVTLAVRDAWITLRGTLDRQYRKDAAARAIGNLAGVRGVTNDILVRPHAKAGDAIAARYR